MKKILITGGLGFVGSNFIKYLQTKTKEQLVIFDRLDPLTKDKNVLYYKGNLQNVEDVAGVFKRYGPFSTVYHLASWMPNKEVPDQVMLKSNVVGTKNLIEKAVKEKVEHFIFTSSNVTYGIPKKLPLTEEMEPIPLEIYGRSKLLAEKELQKFKGKTNIQIIRCPVISGLGRLGLQAILFEFISENKNVYVLGKGDNKYQFIDVMDVCSVLEKASHMKGFDIYNIGANKVMTLRELYEHVIQFAKSNSKIIGIPMGPSLFLMSILDKLNVSPLGVYQYSMIGRSIYFDTTKVKKKLHWQPKMTNLDTFIENYKWYIKHKGNFTQIGSGNFSANRSLPKMGILKLLKIFS